MSEDIHTNHNNIEKSYQEIIEFYNEHKHFLIPAITQNEKHELEIYLISPCCYSINCHFFYTIDDISRILEKTIGNYLILKEDLQNILKTLTIYNNIGSAKNIVSQIQNFLNPREIIHDKKPEKISKKISEMIKPLFLRKNQNLCVKCLKSTVEKRHLKLNCLHILCNKCYLSAEKYKDLIDNFDRIYCPLCLKFGIFLYQI